MVDILVEMCIGGEEKDSTETPQSRVVDAN